MFIDISDKKVYVILKNGFDKIFLEKEIYVRNNFKYLPIPNMYTYDIDGLWYSEEYVSGKSPNRFKDNMSMRILMDIIEQLHKMLNKTRKDVSLSDYVLSLKSRIEKNIEQINCIDINVRDSLKNITKILVIFLQRCLHQSLTVAYCHGDFHQGNMISNGKEHWILDWENSGQKQIGYDLFILLLESRIESGFSDRFLRLVNNKLNIDKKKMVDNWPGLQWGNRSFKERDLILFLLEEIDFYVNENSNIFFEKNTGRLNARLNCFKEILDSLPFNIQ